jgi:hypothetical protein
MTTNDQFGGVGGVEPTGGLSGTGAATSGVSSPEPEEIRAEIEQTRADLGDSVDALAAKADVRTRAKQSAAAARDRAKGTAQQAAQKVRDKPAPVGGALAGIAAAAGAAVLIRRRRAAKVRAQTRTRFTWPR